MIEITAGEEDLYFRSADVPTKDQMRNWWGDGGPCVAPLRCLGLDIFTHTRLSSAGR
jgi:hypothetical protein